MRNEPGIGRGLAVLAAAGILAAAGCECGPDVRQVRAAGGSESRDAAMLGPLAALAGEWEVVDDDGGRSPGSTFAVSSSGSTVREVMFPGTDDEMTNVYHMDGERLVMTHYCGIGNQPRLVAGEPTRVAAGTVYEFRYESVSNLREEHDGYMGGLRLTLVDADTLVQDWTFFDAGGNAENHASFRMIRRRH